MAMKNIYVVTHTESIHHIKGKVGGWFDTGLTENGKKQAASVAKRLDEWVDERIAPAPDDDRLDHLSIEGGESKREFIARIYRAVDGVIADDNPNQIIVTHGFALTFVVARWHPCFA